MTSQASAEDLDQLPRWVPPLVYLALTLLVFRRYLAAGAGEMLLGQDTIAAGIMMRSFFVDQFQQLHRLPLWNPYLYGGVPTIEAGSGDILYPTSILHFVLPLTQALAWKLILHVFLAGVFTYLAARAFGVRRYIALFVGAGYLLSANLVSLVWGGQDGKMYVITLFPAALGLLVSALERGSWIRYVWFGVIAGMMLLAHPQLAYYAYVALGAYALFAVWLRRAEGAGPTLRKVGGGAVALALALSIAAIVLAPMYSYLRHYSPRAGPGKGFEYAASYSMHAAELVSAFVPDFAGTEVQADTYWGKNPLKHNLEYGGAVVLVLGIAGFFALRGDLRRWGLGGLALVALLYSLGAGTPFFRLVWSLVPGLKNFRAPSLAMFIFFTGISLLAALGLERGLATGDDRARRFLRRGLAAGTGLALFIAILVQVLGGGFYQTWTGLFGAPPVTKSAQFEANLSNLVFGAVLTAIWCGIAWAAMAAQGRGALRARTVMIVLTVVTVVDLLRVDDRFIQVVRYADFFPDDPGITTLRNSLLPGERVLAFRGVFPTEGYLATYRIPEVFGYHGNQLRWYDELTRREQRESISSGAELQRYWMGFLASPVFRALAARVVIVPFTVELPGYQQIGGNDRVLIYRNTGAVPGAVIVPRLRIEADSARQLELLWSPGFDVASEVVVDQPIAMVGQGGGTGSVQFVGDGADTVALQATTTGPAILLLSRTFHPSWKATVDGAAAPVLRADYGLIGVPLSSAGVHRIDLRYRPAMVEYARSVSLSGWLVALLATLLAWLLHVRGRSSRA